jgi:hypothetical protein
MPLIMRGCFLCALASKAFLIFPHRCMGKSVVARNPVTACPACSEKLYILDGVAIPVAQSPPDGCMLAASR